MHLTAAVRFDVPSAELLERLVSEALPHRLRSTPPERVVYRDVYFDTAEQSLERQGVWCRLRYRSDDRRELTVAFGTNAGPEGRQLIAAEVQDLEPAPLLAGATEPARRLRAFVDPARLRVSLELQTLRWTRRARPWWSWQPRFELVYDVVTVWAGTASGSYQDLAVRRLRTGPPRLARLARSLQERHGLQPAPLEAVERARLLLRELEVDALAQAVRSSREVTVIAFEQDHIALRCAGGALTLPVTGGHGEEACRSLMRECFGSAEGQVRLLATVTASATRPVLEVWLARKLHGGLTCCDGANLEWLSVEEFMRRVGSPALRDPRTLAALTVAVRSDFMPEWPATARSGGSAAPDAGPPVPSSSPETRRVLAGLREPVLPQPALDPGRPAAAQFINAELSSLEFQARVLALAEDASVPLLERVRFLSIVSANLDEFFMVRVGALQDAVAEGRIAPSMDGLTPQEQLDAIAIRAAVLAARQQRCLERELLPALAAHRIWIRRWAELPDAQREHLRRYFMDEVFPLLTPHAVTRAPGHAFPRIRNLAMSLATLVRDPRTGPIQFAHVQLPAELPRWVPVGDGATFVPLEEVARANLEPLYPGRQVDSALCFRVTRRRDVQVDERGATNLLQAVEEEVRRPFGRVVRLEVERGMPGPVRDLLLRELRFEHSDEVSTLGPADIYDVDGPLDHRGLAELSALPRPDLRYPPLQARTPPDTARPIFEVLAERDLLVHHPYDPFESTVQRFVVEAAHDPAVRSIHLTLYRAGGQSAIADALLRAAARGKEVTVFVEVKARFDEERNIDWARRLEGGGIHVVYGLPELKMHAKLALVVRREGRRIRRYVHIGTGNYNADTARAYTDVGLLSADPALGEDVNDLFNELSGSGKPPVGAYRRLLVAPADMRRRFIALIAREADHARTGRGGRIRAKLNGLSDPEIIAALYRASQAGAQVDLIVRGICSLRPGVPGLSERIRVLSILGRFLEHARIYIFDNAGQPDYFIGSADWRPRNLSRRIEVVTPVRDAAARERLERILTAELEDPTAWVLESDGSYTRRPQRGGRKP